MSNLYACQLNENGQTNRGKGWYYLTVCKLHVLFGRLIFMGLKVFSNLRLHWFIYKEFFRSQEVLGAMSRVRFEAMLRCFHLVKNREVVVEKGDPRNDKLAKTRWLIDAHHELYQKNWALEQNLK